jgi:hypothetical protein
VTKLLTYEMLCEIFGVQSRAFNEMYAQESRPLPNSIFVMQVVNIDANGVWNQASDGLRIYLFSLGLYIQTLAEILTPLIVAKIKKA